MEKVQNIVEYYDELYPVTKSQKDFFKKESENFKNPVKYLKIACGTGNFEVELAKEGADVTGIENYTPLLDTANRHRRTQLMSIRFFQMTTTEMNRFLGKGFYNICACLDNRVELIADSILIRKFFYDTKELLSKNGKLILKLRNYENLTKPVEILPEVSNIRVTMKTKIFTNSDNSKLLDQEIETGNGHVYPIFKDEPIYPLKKSEIIEFAKEVGYKNFEFYSNFEKAPLTKDSQDLIAVLS